MSYDPVSLFRYNVSHKLECSVLCGILHMSSKYNVPHIRHRAIIALQHYFPPTLDGFCVAKAVRTSLRVRDTFHIANVASQTDASALLASVLIFCAQQHLDYILDGVPHPGGAKELTRTNRSAVLHARHQLNHLARSVTLRALYYSEECTRQNCLLVKRTEGAKLLEGRNGLVNPLSKFSCLSDIPVCADCREKLHEGIIIGREEVWQKVPEIFGLAPDWDTLVKKDDADYD
ncbi:hypothetical protein EUX98_g7559 [Antrodiella citrinella]|uniref:Uncharacterized protein n=1 Tax=Antrodiella citrinella TaxID=2447956 RepID=A0A4S4MNL1_9APHY|nr:hypothetical protein EUX98_g7559 [Antrodiella citrinella]